MPKKKTIFNFNKNKQTNKNSAIFAEVGYLNEAEYFNTNIV